MKTAIYYESESTDAHVNLAIEEYLLHTCEKTSIPSLYLWQNENAVVIGRNQSAYTECNIDYAKSHGIQIARRTTGGGAVYHDLGNLNFSFILPRELHDLERSTNIVVNALNQIGINAEKTGRNDICLNGLKISGSAFYSNEQVGLHHGTVLYRTNKEIMNNVLSVPGYKLARHGVPSVRSRVGDIVSANPSVNLKDIKEAIKCAFCENYNVIFKKISIVRADIIDLVKIFSSEEWNIHKIRDYEKICEREFSWGNIRVSFLYDGNTLKAMEMASDTLFADFVENIKNTMNETLRKGADINQLFALMKAQKEDDRKMIEDIETLFKTEAL